jgi:hypothetical protein
MCVTLSTLTRYNGPKSPNIDNFLTLQEYIAIAEKSIKCIANRFQPGLAKKMLCSEEAISDVAFQVMIGDWGFDASKNKAIASWRRQSAQYGIQQFLSRSKSKRAKFEQTFVSLDWE